MSEIQTFIIDYIKDNTVLDNPIINEKSDFVEEGLLDSFAILNLIMTLESQYSVKFDPAELANPDLRCVGMLAQATAQKRNG